MGEPPCLMNRLDDEGNVIELFVPPPSQDRERDQDAHQQDGAKEDARRQAEKP